ncbi:uncharacterized protein HMPREF1541_08338 [Cyphellophora europaea CBS 101466]|uniref:Polymerase/histidinol phosphatase N-terminal domain-containing protein n=1 Tax=Cyphellophora europaea (strain CBS 101466) TaxID=1220924 RepID=W2RLJ2_CYPE1|nr:uncharacterized protein HMPREF1541_08338 [Cyphellophora europaea CBS 101466]ETN37347.1 hypothetical protein HMPREF1541_08338 [Cyphellophora europaea CBS 101466]
MHFTRALGQQAVFGLASLTTILAANTTDQQHLSGHIAADKVMTFVYAPFTVLPGCTSLSVYQNYSLPANNSIDLGIYSPLGLDPISALNGSGSRGWSGGFRKNFTISVAEATPGYNAGGIEAGVWNVVLGPYVVLPEGVDWWVDVELVYDDSVSGGYWHPSYARMDYEPLLSQQGGSAADRGREKWLRGDFHMHSIYSDGRYLPSEQMENALKKGLDFIFFSEHNTDSGNNEVAGWRPEGAQDLLVGRAIEVTTRHGHWQAIGLAQGQKVEWRYTNETDGYAVAAQGVRESGALVSINHPFINCSRCDWTLDWEHHDAIEIWNGRWSEANEQAVRKWHEELMAGKKITAIGGSDAHHPPDQNGLPTTVVKVSAKSQAGIVEGVREGGVYLVEGPGMEIEFGVEVAGTRFDVGQVAGASKGSAVLVARGFGDSVACFLSEQGYFHNQSLVDGGSIELAVEGLAFVRVEIRNSTDIMLGLTNPVFFE